MDAVSRTEPPSQKVVSPDVAIVAAGTGFTVTVVPGEVAEQPLAFVTITLKVPLDVTSIDCELAPFDQSQEVPALAVSVTDPPSQNVVSPDAAIVAAGSGFTVTVVAGEVELQPFAFVTVTV